MDFDLLLAGIRVLFPDLDLLNQHDRQLAGQCVQLQKLLGLSIRSVCCRGCSCSANSSSI